MTEKPRMTIALTREQQLAVLATTGLLVKTLEIEAGSVAEEGTLGAQVPLPRWLATETAG